jgi:hypothetical protein
MVDFQGNGWHVAPGGNSGGYPFEVTNGAGAVDSFRDLFSDTTATRSASGNAFSLVQQLPDVPPGSTNFASDFLTFVPCDDGPCVLDAGTGAPINGGDGCPFFGGACGGDQSSCTGSPCGDAGACSSNALCPDATEPACGDAGACSPCELESAGLGGSCEAPCGSHCSPDAVLETLKTLNTVNPAAPVINAIAGKSAPPPSVAPAARAAAGDRVLDALRAIDAVNPAAWIRWMSGGEAPGCGIVR